MIVTLSPERQFRVRFQYADDPSKKKPQGTKTSTCHIIPVVETRDANPIASATVRPHPSDLEKIRTQKGAIRQRGRKEALRRALQEANFSRQERGNFWKAYFSHCNDPHR